LFSKPSLISFSVDRIVRNVALLEGKNVAVIPFFLKARLLWELDQEKTTHLPQFVDQALKLLNLKQVAFEIENSVMSKVSCTACKAGEEIPNDANDKKTNFPISGAGLLQHYIKSGKSEKEIKKTIYQFCVNLKIQTARVCEGITELFAGEVIYVLGKVSIGEKDC
jgi:sphingomyelin phosphodiesterase